jgi:hypothetical protein
MTGPWKLSVAGSTLLVLAACGGGGGSQQDASPSVESSAEPTAGGGSLEAQIARAATSFQASVDAVVVRRARALAERSEAADRYNESTGSAEKAAFEDLKDSCGPVRDAYDAFAVSVREAKFSEADKPDVDKVIAATGSLVSVLGKYADAKDSAAIKAINEEEVPLTEEWSKSVDALATRLGARGLPGNVPAVPSGERMKTSEFSLVVPTGMEGHPSITLHISTPDEIVAINAGAVLDADGNPMTTGLAATAEDACVRATKEMQGVDRKGISDLQVGPESGKTCIHDLPGGTAEQTVIVSHGGKIYVFSLNAPKDKFDDYDDEFKSVLDSVTFP